MLGKIFGFTSIFLLKKNSFFLLFKFYYICYIYIYVFYIVFFKMCFYNKFFYNMSFKKLYNLYASIFLSINILNI